MPNLKRALLVFLMAPALVCMPACAERELPITIGSPPGEQDAGPTPADASAPKLDAAPKLDTAPPRMDACTPTTELCNGIDDDCNGTLDDVAAEVLTRTESCGSCNNVCQDRPNALTTCQAGTCGYSCVTGAIDIDNGATNGCECILVGAERDMAGDKPEAACDGLDNDCDGKTDEGFDLDADLKHCGACNRLCSFPFALARCDQGVCKQTDCQPGFSDSDPTKAGCECQKTNGGVELCDGVDNDCDGLIDDGVTPTITCRGMGVCAGVAPVCGPVIIGKDAAMANVVVTTWSCPYPAALYQESGEDMAKGCDGLDNDCDGLVDEGFRVGAACVADTDAQGQKVFGECVRQGRLRCKADKTGTECDTPPGAPGAETCDGFDNDCDGKTDELLSATDKTSDDRLVVLSPAGRTVTMFAYEASRHDANTTTPGMVSNRRPCSVKGRQPWGNVTKEEAQAACQTIGAGWRLCTKEEWLDACNGGGNSAFPYGNLYDGAKCNGADFQATPAPLPVGNAAMCLSDQGDPAVTDDLFDMSGNLKEWVLTTLPTATPLGFELRGGAYNNTSYLQPDPSCTSEPCTAMRRVAPGLRCDGNTPAPGPAECKNGSCPNGQACSPQAPCPDIAVRLPSVGFRCCKDGVL